MCTHPSCDRERRFRIEGMDGEKDNDVPSCVGGTGHRRLLGNPQGESAVFVDERYAYTATDGEERMAVKGSVPQRSRHGGWGYLKKEAWKVRLSCHR